MENAQEYFADQTICFATSSDFKQWTNFEETLRIEDADPDNQYLLRLPDFNHDRTVHAWRDPYLFVYENQLFLLVAAKRKDLPNNSRGCIALFRLQENQGSKFEWKLICPSIIGGYEELEVPQIYIEEQKQNIWIVASTWDDRDYQISWLRNRSPEPPFYRRHGYLLGFEIPVENFNNILKNTYSNVVENNGIVMVEPEAMFYAGRIVPERTGCILGFDPRTGSPQTIYREVSSKFNYLSPSLHKCDHL